MGLSLDLFKRKSPIGANDQRREHSAMYGARIDAGGVRICGRTVYEGLMPEHHMSEPAVINLRPEWILRPIVPQT